MIFAGQDPLVTGSIVAVIIAVFGWIGAGTVAAWLVQIADTVLWRLASKEQAALDQRKRKLIALQKKHAQTSSMENFAVWARQRREIDAELAALQSMAQESGAKTRGSQWRVSIAVRGLLLLLRLATVLSFRREGLFYPTPAWLGEPVATIVSLPFAPSGAVSIAVWMHVCGSVTSSLLTAGHSLLRSRPKAEQQ